jgi:hypothetical protein
VFLITMPMFGVLALTRSFASDVTSLIVPRLEPE